MRWLAKIPNALSLSRIALAASFPFLPGRFYLAALTIALLTEFLDGALARRFGWETLLGQLLDPIADRFLFLGVGLTFINAGLFGADGFLFLALRDLLVAGGFFAILLFRYRGFAGLAGFKPNFLGKLTTALQYAVFFYVIFFPGRGSWLIALTGTVGLLSAATYASRLGNRHTLGRAS